MRRTNNEASDLRPSSENVPGYATPSPLGGFNGVRDEDSPHGTLPEVAVAIDVMLPVR